MELHCVSMSKVYELSLAEERDVSFTAMEKEKGIIADVIEALKQTISASLGSMC